MNLEDLDRVTLVAGAPSSGKTEFALGMLVAAMRRYGDGNAVHGFHMLSFLVVRMLFGRSLWILS